MVLEDFLDKDLVEQKDFGNGQPLQIGQVVRPLGVLAAQAQHKS